VSIDRIIFAIRSVFPAAHLAPATAARVTPEPDSSGRATTAEVGVPGGGLQRWWWPVVERQWCVTCQQRERNTGSNLCARCDADEALLLDWLLDA
jgi:hypothetical protein